MQHIIRILTLIIYIYLPLFSRSECNECDATLVIKINERGIECCQQCCNQWPSVSPMYIFEIPEKFISDDESKLLNESNEFKILESLWKEFRETNKNMMIFAFNINLYLEKSLKNLQTLDHPFVNEWECNLEDTFQSDIDNLIEQIIEFSHKAWEICAKISEQFEYFMKSKQILTKIKEKISRIQRGFQSINTTHDSIKEASDEFKNPKIKERRKVELFNKLKELKKEGDKILKVNWLIIKLEYVEEKLNINSNHFEKALDFWKKLSYEFQENENFTVENIKDGELCVKECALNYIKEKQKQIMLM
ncbi:10963_t:CDS:2, partial [Dentiscutata heterogama]